MVSQPRSEGYRLQSTSLEVLPGTNPSVLRALLRSDRVVMAGTTTPADALTP